jgi:hypothetical protein
LLQKLIDQNQKPEINPYEHINQNQLDIISNRLDKMDLINGWLEDENGEMINFDKQKK